MSLLQTTDNKDNKDKSADDDDDDDDDDDESVETGCTLFVKNLNFSTTEDALKQVGFSFLYLSLFRYFDVSQ